ncbi:hypothetical protein SEVIR_5G344250v4 [Setaria viridis]
MCLISDRLIAQALDSFPLFAAPFHVATHQCLISEIRNVRALYDPVSRFTKNQIRADNGKESPDLAHSPASDPHPRGMCVCRPLKMGDAPGSSAGSHARGVNDRRVAPHEQKKRARGGLDHENARAFVRLGRPPPHLPFAWE